VRLIFHRNRRSRKDLIEGFDLFFVVAVALLNLMENGRFANQ
jgi:hypothetical protein